MFSSGIFQMILFIALMLLLAIPLGYYMAHIFKGESTFMTRAVRPLEKMVYKLTGVTEDKEMSWWQYFLALLTFNLLGMIILFILQLIQGILPLNPQGFGALRLDLAFNTAVSFMTNTNWQAYSGESTMSYFTQMAGITVQNYLSAATGIAVVVALIRGLTRHTAKTIGNFWVDLTRSILYILLPLSILVSILLVSQGVIQNLSPNLMVSTLEGAKQTIAMGPVASQEAIKMIGTNGGGFFNANSAHPFENPTPLTNLIELLSVLVIPAGLTITFGRMTGDTRQGRVILGAMLALFIVALGVCYTSEMAGNPQVAALGVSAPTAMEGKEVRFGIPNSALFTTVTTAASCGAVNNMHDSMTPIGGFVPLLQIMLGEVIFGGVGAGLYGMLIFVILTVFILGLMVGRTPEYLGKKIEFKEMKMAVLAILLPAATILVGSALAAATKSGIAPVLNPGPHGFSEILYAFSSGAGNNGSAFAGLNANTLFYNLALGISMLIGRFGVILPVLAIAGSMVGKKVAQPGPGTFKTSGLLFAGMLAGTVLVVGALTFFPALALGPIIEHLLMLGGKVY